MARNPRKNVTGRYWIAAVALALLSPAARPQRAPESENRDSLYTIRLDVERVVLRTTVEDRKGRPLAGLAQDDFQVYEDDVRQEIKFFSSEDIPVTVGLVIDNSGSMGPKRREVIDAALAFARASNPQDQIFVLNFNEHLWFGLPDGTPFTDQVPVLERALTRTIADGRTALYDAITLALDRLKMGARDKKVLIVISDGGDNASRRGRAEIMTLAQHSNAIIYTIGLFDDEDPDRNPRVLKQLSQVTGGEVFLPGSLTRLVPVCEQIAHDIRSQYTLAYQPANRKQDGTYRRIEVKVKARGRGRLTARTRSGYYAPLPQID